MDVRENCSMSLSSPVMSCQRVFSPAAAAAAEAVGYNASSVEYIMESIVILTSSTAAAAACPWFSAASATVEKYTKYTPMNHGKLLHLSH